MRSILYRLTYTMCRALRPAGHRHLRQLRPGDTVLYLQFERALGCCVHGTPLVEAVRAVAVDVRIVVASQGPGAATLRDHPGISKLIQIETNPVGSPQQQWRAASELRSRLREAGVKPDLIVQDASSRRGSSALFASLLRLGPVIGFGDAPALYDRFLPYDEQKSLIDNTLRISGAVGGKSEHREPAVYFTSEDLQHAKGLLNHIRSEHVGLVGFVLQGSGGQATAWHADRFARVLQTLEDEGYGTVFFGTAADAHGIDATMLLARSQGISLAGKTTIPQAAAALAACDLLITVDTGTMHLGRAVQVPMVVLGPSWQKPLEWLPLGVPTAVILRGPDCDHVPPGYQLDEIDASSVLNAAHDLLTRYPPSATSREQRIHARLAPGLV